MTAVITATCTATITVQDNINPTAICQNLTVQLDASGAGSITAARLTTVLPTLAVSPP